MKKYWNYIFGIMLVLIFAVGCAKSDKTVAVQKETEEADLPESCSEASSEAFSVELVEDEWNPEDYVADPDIIKVEQLALGDDIEAFCSSYRIRYQSDDCEVVAYLSVPNEYLKDGEPCPCIIYNRGGNGDYGALEDTQTAAISGAFDMAVIATQYRGTDSGTGKDEFGGAEIDDVKKLIDFCEEFTFIDSSSLYMMGTSRGGMMTYMALRGENRIKKAVVISGVSDAFMIYDYRPDMRDMMQQRIGGTPETMQDAYVSRSATYWANEINTPVLMIHSTQDSKVDYAQAQKMAAALETVGAEVKFITREDDVHGIEENDLNTIMEWFGISEQ